MKKLIFILFLFCINDIYSEEINKNIFINKDDFTKNDIKDEYDKIISENLKGLEYSDENVNLNNDNESNTLICNSYELFKKGKSLYNEKKYYDAKEIFEQLIDPIRKDNIYAPYALFYCALINYNLGELNDSRYFFEYLKDRYSDWEQINEVIFWLAKINFENKKYLSAIKIINEIKEINQKKVYFKKGNLVFKRSIKKNKRIFLEELIKLKKYYLINADTPLPLQKILEKYPKDELTKDILAKRIALDPFINLENPWSQNIIKKFNLNIAKYDLFYNLKSIKKKSYNIAVMLPFFCDSILKKGNTFVLNLYKGINLALENLRNQGLKINLYCYDTKKNTEIVNKLLQQKELETMNLIIGPLYPNTVNIVADFAKEKRINMVNPLSYNSDLAKNNPFVFLFKPSSETQAYKAIEYIYEDKMKEKKIGIIHSSNKKDLKKALLFKKYIEKDQNNTIDLMMELDDIQAQLFLRKFRNNKDHKKTEKQIEEEEKQKAIFDNITHLYVATNNKLIIGSILAIIEMRKIKPVIIGHQKWLEYKSVDFGKIQKYKILLIAPEFINYNKNKIHKFRLKYYKKYQELPDLYSCIGYEIMNYFGNALEKYGIYFQKEWNNKEVAETKIFEKVSYNKFRDNQEIEILTLKNGKFNEKVYAEKFHPYIYSINNKEYAFN
ncbi:MAG: amino acid ABC transporter substrate-binding protein [Bacteroidetes bacterium]|nr:amino acid ABC transporter substrate-binding protein [Bacteroidota bacterium]